MVSLLLCAPSIGQDLAAAQPPDSPRTAAAPASREGLAGFSFRRDVAEVEVWLTAVDRAGRAVDGLTAAQLTVSDDGRPVPGFTYFERREESLLRWVILVDGSDSMRRKFQSARAAALAFMRQWPGSKSPAQVKYFVGRNIYCEADCPNRLPEQVRPEGETALFDRLLETAEAAAAPGEQKTRTIVILFSDGEDNWSQSDLEGAVQSLQQRNIAVYSLSAHNSRLQYQGDRVLRRLSQATGGRAFFLKRYDRAEEVLSEIQNELRIQYVVGFRPQAPVPWSYHELSVAAAPSLEVRLQARKGYLVHP